MADTGWLTCGLGEDVADVGTLAWSTPTNIQADDANYASQAPLLAAPVDEVVKLVIDGSVTGNNLSSGTAWLSSEGYVGFGGTSNLWGTSSTVTQVNASNFGVVIQVSAGAYFYTHYLKATTFGASVPDGSTILGIEAQFKRKYTAVGPNYSPMVNCVQMRLTYETTNLPMELLRRGILRIPANKYIRRF